MLDTRESRTKVQRRDSTAFCEPSSRTLSSHLSMNNRHAHKGKGIRSTSMKVLETLNPMRAGGVTQAASTLWEMRSLGDSEALGPAIARKWPWDFLPSNVNFACDLEKALWIKCRLFGFLMGFSGPCYRGHLGPSGPKWQKDFEISSRRLSTLGAQKVENESKSALLWLRFGLFGPLGLRGLRTHLRLFLPLWTRRSQVTPLAGKTYAAKVFANFLMFCRSWLMFVALSADQITTKDVPNHLKFCPWQQNPPKQLARWSRRTRLISAKCSSAASWPPASSKAFSYSIDISFKRSANCREISTPARQQMLGMT